MYVHVPKDKRTKLDPSGRKGIFVGYDESVKGFRIHFPGNKKVEVSPHVIFDEDAAFSKSGKKHADEDHEEEHEHPRVAETCIGPIQNVEEEQIPENHNMEETQIPMEIHQEMIS